MRETKLTILTGGIIKKESIIIGMKAELRYALYQAALIASTKNRYFIEYYTNKLRGQEREKGIKTKMRVKLAAKLYMDLGRLGCRAGRRDYIW